MKITATFSSYMIKRFLVNLAVLLLALLAIIYLFDTVELIRRASKKEIPLSLVLQMSLLKLPDVGQTIFPFAILFSGMFTFWQLTRRYELIVARASGFSIWQLLTPIIGTAIFIGFFQMCVINPLGAILIGKFQHLERTYLTQQENQIAIFKEGLWLKQNIFIEQAETNPNDNSNKTLLRGYAILHAEKIKHPEWVLQNVMILYFTDDNQFIQRVDAKNAELSQKNWVLSDVLIHKNIQEPQKLAQFKLPTKLTTQDIEESFSSPQSMSFWALPNYINTLEKTGFDAARLKIHYQNLLSQPLLFAAMILLAAIVSMRPPRAGGTLMMVMIGIFSGFILFFFSSYLQALGASHQIPVIMAAWAPALMCFLIGLSIIMNKEDG